MTFEFPGKRARGRCVLILAVFSAFVSSALAQNKEGARFRGVAVNQTEPQVRAALKANGFTVAEKQRSWTVLQDRKQCGSIHFDERGTVFKLAFTPCYFAAAMGLHQFATRLVENYRLSVEGPMIEEERLYGSRNTLYRGHADTGEKVLIGQADGPVAAPIVFLVERVPGTGKPRFD